MPADAFPLTLRAYDSAGTLVWLEADVLPGAVYVPPLAQTYGPVRIEVQTASGETLHREP